MPRRTVGQYHMTLSLKYLSDGRLKEATKRAERALELEKRKQDPDEKTLKALEAHMRRLEEVHLPFGKNGPRA